MPCCHLFVLSVTNKDIFPDYASLLPQVNPVSIGIQGDHGMVEVEATTEVEKAVDPNMLYMKLIPDTSKPIFDATNPEVDVVELLQAYGMVPIEGSDLKHRKVKKVATDEISLVPTQTLNDIHTIEPVSKPLLL